MLHVQDGTRQFTRMALAPGLVLQLLTNGPRSIAVHTTVDPEFAGALGSMLPHTLAITVWLDIGRSGLSRNTAERAE